MSLFEIFLLSMSQCFLQGTRKPSNHLGRAAQRYPHAHWLGSGALVSSSIRVNVFRLILLCGGGGTTLENVLDIPQQTIRRC